MNDTDFLREELSGFADSIKGKTFLVTGGAGFLGSWLCDALDAFGANIICVDNLITGTEDNIVHLMKKENFAFIKEDVCDFSYDGKVDCIVHMAGIASPPIYQEKPVETLDANVLGTGRMLELAREKKVKAMLFTSTSEIYGNPPDSEVPTKETYYGYVNSYGPRAMYDEGKRAAEAYCYSYFSKYGVPVRVARIFNTYGPRLDVASKASQGRALVKFIRKCLSNEPIPIYGNKLTRSFCYVTDQINGLLRLLLTPGIDGEAVNIGNPTETPLEELIKMTIRMTGSSSELKYNIRPDYDIRDDPRRRCPDIGKARELLGFSPKVSLEEGLEKTIRFVKEQDF